MTTATYANATLTDFANILFCDDDFVVLQTTAYDKQNPVEMNNEGKDSFGTFNLGLHVNDEPKQVIANRCHLLELLNQHMANDTDEKLIQQIHWLNQVHGNTVVQIGEQSVSMTPANADAMTTTEQGTALAIMTADCVPVVLFQPTTGQIAAIHAGWKGLVNGVIANTVQTFAKPDSTNPIYAWIGACISVDNYEVSQAVVQQLCAGSVQSFPFTQTAEELAQQISRPHTDADKAWLDIQKLAKLQLQLLGCEVKLANPPCSYADNQCYSYRRKTHKRQPNTGRMAMIVVRI